MRRWMALLLVGCGPIYPSSPSSEPPSAASMPSPAPAPLPAPVPQPIPPAPTGVIPVPGDEQLVATLPVLDAIGPAPLAIGHLGIVLVGYAIGVDLAWTDPSLDGVVELELSGPGVRETRSLRLQQPQRVIFKARPNTEGEYIVRARAGGHGDRRRAIRATTN